jgi:hypothetical protein
LRGFRSGKEFARWLDLRRERVLPETLEKLLLSELINRLVESSGVEPQPARDPPFSAAIRKAALRDPPLHTVLMDA